MTLTLNAWAALVAVAALIALVQIVRIAARPHRTVVRVIHRPTDDLRQAIARDLRRATAQQPRQPRRVPGGVASPHSSMPPRSTPPTRMPTSPSGVSPSGKGGAR